MKTEEYKKMYSAEKRFWWFRAKNMLVSELAKTFFKKEGQYFDIGCGTGSNLDALSGDGSWLGLDASKDAINWCAKRNIKNLILADAEKLPFKENCFTGATVLDTLEHIQNDGAVLSEINRALCPGAYLIITVPAYRFLWGPHDEALGHVRRYRKKDVHSLLNGAGFKSVRVTHFLGLLCPLMMAARTMQKLRPKKSDTISYDWPSWLNILLLCIVRLELILLKYFNMPLGTTIAAVAKKV